MKKMCPHLRFLQLCLALGALVGSFTFCRADPTVVSTSSSEIDAGYLQAIPAAYDQINSDFASNHLDSACVFVSNDYRQVDPHGNALDKNGTRKKFQDERKQIRTIETKCFIEAMTVAPDGIHVQMATHSSGTGVKRILFLNIKGTFTNDLRVNDVWVSTPDGWRLKSRLMLQDDSKVRRS